jgi:hypothetical protein
MLDQILKNMNLFVDGRGYAGNVQEMEPPTLTVQTEEYRGGGMDAPVNLDMGMEALECSFTLTQYDKDVLKQFGLAIGSVTPLTMRGHVESDDGTTEPIVINMRGKVTTMEYGTWTPGEKATLQATVSLRYYKYTQGGEVLHEIDVPGMKRIIGGVDQLAEMRANLGI